MFKMELQTEAQRLCDKSFSVVSEISSAVTSQSNPCSVSSCTAGNLTVLLSLLIVSFLLVAGSRQ